MNCQWQYVLVVTFLSSAENLHSILVRLTAMAKVVTRPQRFTPEEWKLASKVKHKNTERDRAGAERLILECDRLDQEGRGTVERTLADVNKKLGKFL
jgi:hypothetical protein